METMMPNSFEGNAQSETLIGTEVNFEAEEAREMYEEKHQLVKDVFEKIGVEHYMDITAILHKKYFGQMDTELISKHIMYRALNGSIIDLTKEIESNSFIYDEHDKFLEEALASILNVNNFDEVKNVIESLKNVDSEEY